MPEIAALLGGIKVHTANNRGWTPAEMADRALDKIISIGDESPAFVRDQALAYKERIRAVVEFYLREAQKSERANICAKLSANGHDDLANIVRSV